ncbi:hypothetical protein HDV01_003878, partial [Terramyces sp. JEL0728]
MSLHLPPSIEEEYKDKPWFLGENNALSPDLELSSLSNCNLSAKNPLVLKVAGDGSSLINSKVSPANKNEDDYQTLLKEATENANNSKTFPLLGSEGVDFVFSDRGESLQTLFEGLSKRYTYWNKGKEQGKYRDKFYHPIAFAAAGPGSGKSRFLQELPNSFKNVGEYLKDEKHDGFKECIKKTRFINISFNTITPYTKDDTKHSIRTSICLRILYQFHHAQKDISFEVFFSKFCNTSLTIDDVLDVLKDGNTCIVLAVDEINHIYRYPAKFKDLFQILGALSTCYKPFFVPVFAGTVIEAIQNYVTRSTHPPLSIPLPTLSYESCLNIFEKKGIQLRDEKFAKLIMDMGGHPRALEYLYNSSRSIESKYVDLILYEVGTKIAEKYQPQTLELTKVLAYSYLSRDVETNVDVEAINFTNYLKNLMEKGIIKVMDGIIHIPYIFVMVHLTRRNFDRKQKKVTGWQNLTIENGMWWQSWEIFNNKYNYFRLSLMKVIELKTVTILEYFNGAKISPSIKNMKIRIPENEIAYSVIDYRYPKKEKNEQFPVGTCVLNAAGAPFDSFMYLDTGGKEPMLFAFQYKFAKKKYGLKVDNQNIQTEYEKIKASVEMRLSRQEFICVLIARCGFKGSIDENELPNRCVVISVDEHLPYFGFHYSQRLKFGKDIFEILSKESLTALTIGLVKSNVKGLSLQGRGYNDLVVFFKYLPNMKLENLSFFGEPDINSTKELIRTLPKSNLRQLNLEKISVELFPKFIGIVSIT